MGCCFSYFTDTPNSEYSPLNSKNGNLESDVTTVELNAHNLAYQNRQDSLLRDDSGRGKNGFADFHNEDISAADSTSDNTAFHVVPDDRTVLELFDSNSSVFKVSSLEQKFTNKSSYDNKFAWISANTRTLNLSDHASKERRHKEASLTDVVSVIAGPPDKYKPKGGEVPNLNPNHCLSIKFIRGGGIDLKFKTKEERDSWYKVISELVMQQKKNTDGGQRQ